MHERATSSESELRNAGTTESQQQPHLPLDYFSGAADQFVHDSFWLGCLDIEFLEKEFDMTLPMPENDDNGETSVT